MSSKDPDEEFDAIMNGINRDYWRRRMGRGGLGNRIYCLLRWLETF